MQVQMCCFVNLKPFTFLPFAFSRRRRWFCCHPERVLPWRRDVILLLSILFTRVKYVTITRYP